MDLLPHMFPRKPSLSDERYIDLSEQFMKTKHDVNKTELHMSKRMDKIEDGWRNLHANIVVLEANALEIKRLLEELKACAVPAKHLDESVEKLAQKCMEEEQKMEMDRQTIAKLRADIQTMENWVWNVVMCMGIVAVTVYVKDWVY
jgi:DNA repair ATPase RecN